VKPQRVTSSQLAEMGFCEMKARLRAQYGDRDTRESAQLRAAGKQEHERFHEQVTAEHNAGLPPGMTDKRCFVASAVYGPDDWRTDQLRVFRDRVLKRSWLGRAAISVYYAVSPGLAGMATRSPYLKSLFVFTLDHIRYLVVPEHGKEAGGHDDEGRYTQGQNRTHQSGVHPAYQRAARDPRIRDEARDHGEGA